jgi:hypothetical protein
MECASGMRYSMCGGTPQAMCVACGINKVPIAREPKKIQGVGNA